MSREAFQLFFAILTLVAFAGTAVLVVARLLRRRAAWAAGVADAFEGIALPLAFLVALTCTLGSLYFSEVAHFEPCKLCWFQRICMYPLSLILGIAAFRRDRKVWIYTLPLAAIGAVIAAYHVLIEHLPEADKASCSAAAPCTFVWFKELGFITLPVMALAGFLFIVSLVAPAPQEAVPDVTHEEVSTPARV